MKKLFVFVLALAGVFAFSGFASADLADGLIAYYPFNGNADDESGNGHHGTLNDATLVSDRFGNLDSAYYFDGVDDYISIENSEDFEPGEGDYSISLWVKFDDVLLQHGGIFNMLGQTGGAYNSNWVQCATKESGDIVFGMKSGTTPSETDLYTESIALHQWHHLAGVREGQYTLKLYLNGALVDTKSNGALGYIDTFPGYQIRVGCSPMSPYYKGRGIFDDYRIYSRALSKGEVQELAGWILPGAHDFGVIAINSGCAPPQLFTVTNISGMNQEIGTVFITYDGASDYYLENDNCSGKTLEPSEICTCEVVFYPEYVGEETASLEIPFIDPDTPDLVVDLRGEGVDCEDGPVINGIVFDSCISELCTSTITVNATEPCGGDLTYTWEALDGGTIIGQGAKVEFEPPGPSAYPGCDPYSVKVTVTSTATCLSIERTIDIYVKLAGDVDGNGVVNVLDKVQVRNHFGQSGAPGFVGADVNCDGVVNIMDKVQVRNQFGQTGCRCPLCSGLVAYYPFNGNANDESENENHGTVDGATLDTDRFGNENSAYSFDGDDDIDLGTGLGLVNNSANLTIAAWIYPYEVSPSGTGRQYSILGERNAGENYQFAVMDNALYFSFWTNEIESMLFGNQGQIEANTWYFVAVTYDGSLVKFYINAEFDRAEPASGNIDGHNSTLFVGTYNGDDQPFVGKIDDIQIFNRALSKEEITTLY